MASDLNGTMAEVNVNDGKEEGGGEGSLEYDRAVRRFHRLNCLMEALRETLSEENPARESPARVKLCLVMATYSPQLPNSSSASEDPEMPSLIPRDALVEEASVLAGGDSVGENVKANVRARLSERLRIVAAALQVRESMEADSGGWEEEKEEKEKEKGGVSEPYAAVVQGVRDLESGCAAAEAAMTDETAEAEQANAEALRMESENLTRLLKLAAEYKLRVQARSDVARVEHAQAQGAAALCRAERLCEELTADVYSPRAVEALRAMRGLLEREITAQRARLQAAQDEYRKFAGVGLGFAEIAKEYARVRQAIQNKRNALAQLDSSSSFG